MIVVLAQQHDVGRLQVAVDDPQRVRLAQRAADLLGDVDHALLRQRAVLLHRLRERPAVQELHRDEEDPVLGAPVIVQGDRVGMGELGGDRRLEEEALVEVRVPVVAGSQHLERDQPIEGRLQCLVDPAHSAVADGFDHLVAFVDGAPDQRVRLGSDGRHRGGRRSRGHAGTLRCKAGFRPPGDQPCKR